MPSPAAAPLPETPEPALALKPLSTGIRTSDRERQQVVEQLHRALGEGRLDLEETDARVGAAYAARYRTELSPLLADLPDVPITVGSALTWTAPSPSGGAPTWDALWTSTVWRLRVAVLGRQGDAPPSAAQRRSVALLALLALAWLATCAVLGAVMVAA